MTTLENPFVSVGDPAPPTDEAAAPIPTPDLAHGAAADLSDLSCIGEIFVGARKLFDPDPAAYTNADEATYDLLRQMDKPETPDLIEMPYGMDGIFDPPPLFLQAVGY